MVNGLGTTRFLVSWPLQGATSFRSPQSEVVLSDVYWRWIYEALSEVERTTGTRSSFVDRVENGFESDLEKAAVDAAFLAQLRGIDPAAAPSFERLVPAPDSAIPTAQRVLADLVRVVEESIPRGFMEMEMEMD